MQFGTYIYSSVIIPIVKGGRGLKFFFTWNNHWWARNLLFVFDNKLHVLKKNHHFSCEKSSFFVWVVHQYFYYRKERGRGSKSYGIIIEENVYNYGWPLNYSQLEADRLHPLDYPHTPPDYRQTDNTLGPVLTTLYSKFEGNCLLLHSTSQAPNIDTHMNEWTDTTKYIMSLASRSITSGYFTRVLTSKMRAIQFWGNFELLY